jgi:hypothetical protein
MTMGYDDYKHVGSAADLQPEVAYYGILKFSSITIPGDQRSRDCPGHGYPEHTETSVDLQIFTKREAWEAEVARRLSNRYDSGDWVPLILRRPTVKTTVTIGIE